MALILLRYLIRMLRIFGVKTWLTKATESLSPKLIALQAAWILACKVGA